jgi:hypothetical protein
MRAEFGFPGWLSLFFFSFFMVLAWLRPIEWKRRLAVTALGAVAVVLVSLPLLAANDAFPGFGRVLPLLLMPMAYWQTGLFMAPLNETLQRTLASIDRRILSAFENIHVPPGLEHRLRIYFECAYLLVYPMVPSGLFVLYAAGFFERAVEFWTVVLPPAYLCYATLPFARTLPPRALDRVRERDLQRTGIRGFNLFVVRSVTHQANTFPSAHAAAAVAVALELTRVVLWAGIAYLIIAISIMAGAFIGRYHYAMDVVLGGVLACISFLLICL